MEVAKIPDMTGGVVIPHGVLQPAEGLAGFGEPTTKAVLAIRQEALFQMAFEATGKNASEDFSGDVEKRTYTVVVAELEIVFPLMEVDDCDVLEILRDLSLAPHLLEDRCEVIHELVAAMLANLSRDRV
nr:unnamed protein product [Spirometra erinaceieuropaei]